MFVRQPLETEKCQRNTAQCFLQLAQPPGIFNLAILVSNNFRGSQITQFIALAVELAELD